MNFCWIDCESTGLYADKHDVVQVACIPVIDGVKQQSFNEFCQPKNWDAIEDGAIRVHGITREMMKGFQTQEEMLEKFTTYLKQFNCKFIIAGYNVGFDKQFISATFTKCGRPQDFFSLFELNTHDTFKRVKIVKNQIKTQNYKLETLAKHYKIPIQAHDALSDIDATIEVDLIVGDLLGEDKRLTSVSSVAVSRDPSVTFPEPAQLHLHSKFGMVESVPSPQDWAKWCEDNDVPGFSIVDHGSAISMYDMTRIDNDKVVGVPGCGLYFSVDDELYPFNAWAVSTEGYFNLMKLASLGYENQVTVDGVVRPVLTHDNVLDHSEGLRFGTGDVYGSIGSALAKGDVDDAKAAFEQYRSLFQSKLLVEFAPQSITEIYSAKTGFQRIKKNKLVLDGNLGKAYNRFMLGCASDNNIDCIPVSAAHFIEKDDKLLQDVIAKN